MNVATMNTWSYRNSGQDMLGKSRGGLDGSGRVVRPGEIVLSCCEQYHDSARRLSILRMNLGVIKEVKTGSRLSYMYGDLLYGAAWYRETDAVVHGDPHDVGFLVRGRTTKVYGVPMVVPPGVGGELFGVSTMMDSPVGERPAVDMLGRSVHPGDHVMVPVGTSGISRAFTTVVCGVVNDIRADSTMGHVVDWSAFTQGLWQGVVETTRSSGVVPVSMCLKV